MTAHVIDIETRIRIGASTSHRWICSCGRAGRWLAITSDDTPVNGAARRARNGGMRHQRAMDR